MDRLLKQKAKDTGQALNGYFTTQKQIRTISTLSINTQISTWPFHYLTHKVPTVRGGMNYFFSSAAGSQL